MKRWFFLFALPVAFLPAASIPTATLQNQNNVDLNGIWKVSGNKYDEGKEVCIKQTGESIEARFFLQGESDCPIQGGRAVFLKGTVRETHVEGTIYLCTTVEKLITDCDPPLEGWYKSEFDGTAGQDSIKSHVRMDYVNYDVDSKTGKWTNCRVTPQGGTPLTITLTREPCPADICSYQITDEEVQRAVFKALKEHNVQLDPVAQQLLNTRGVGVKATTEMKAGQPRPGNETGFVVWLRPAPVVVLGFVSHTSCTSSDGEGLAVRLMVWQVTVENGKVKVFRQVIQDVTNKGALSREGLDQAMKAGFDQTDLNQYKKMYPPS
jgi:hypothetical protein